RAGTQRGSGAPGTTAHSPQRARPAFLAQQHVRLDVADTGQGHDPAAEHAFEIGEVAGGDAQPVVEETEDMLDGLDLGDGGRGAFEILEAHPALRGKLDPEKHRDAEAERGGIEVDPLSGNDALLFEPPY